MLSRPFHYPISSLSLLSHLGNRWVIGVGDDGWGEELGDYGERSECG